MSGTHNLWSGKRKRSDMSGKNKWRFYKNMGEGSEGSSSGTQHTRPAHLKGKDRGLWYRDNKRRAERDEKQSIKTQCELPEVQRYAHRKKWERNDKKPLGSILISKNKKKNINKLLNETASMYPSSFLKRTNSYEHLEETDFKHEFLQHITGSIIKKLQSDPNVCFQYKNEYLDERFLEELLEKKKSQESYKKMQEVRKKLPSMGMKDEILQLIHNHQVVVISGETGCGKTTQVAQFILDDYITKGKGSECRIICTQPRRISAISVAERVACERGEKLGHSVGFQIRLEKTMPRERGCIVFCTTGVMLKQMEGDPSMSKVTHLILDEIHERDVVSDFLITLLKDVIRYRSDIKVILMSATLNSEAFSKYYNNAPHINIPGFTYPVEEYFLEDVLQFTEYIFEPDRRPVWMVHRDNRKTQEWSATVAPFIRQLEAENKYDRQVIEQLYNPVSEKLNIPLIIRLIMRLCITDNDDGSLLVFVPGFMEIQAVCKGLRESGTFPSSKYIIIPLHSQLPTVDQKQIFNPAPKGMRKIIVSTNIAETSITIDDVTTVIDCGFIKMTNIDPETGIEMLKSEWVSQANAAQRKGRAGRVKPGVCFHLITKFRYQCLNKFMKPEVLRKRLEDVILSLKMLQLGDAGPFLARLMDPPESTSVQQSLDLLQRLGALDHEEGLTPLGFHMAKLPLAPHCSKMLIMAAMFSCLDPILSVAASLGYKDASQLSFDMKEADKQKIELSKGTNSDHLTMHYAIRGFEDASNPYAFCRKYSLSSSILKQLIDMRKEFAKHLFNMKFVKSADARAPSSNCNSDNVGLIKAIISAGLYPNVAIVSNISRRMAVKLTSVLNERMKFHPKSVLYNRPVSSPLIVYYLRLKSSSLFIHDATLVFPLSIVFFGDQFRVHSSNEDDDNDDSFNGVSVNSKMRFLCTESTAFAIHQLRDRLNQILEWKVSHPGFVSWTSETPEVNILRAIMDLITAENDEDQDLSDYDDV